MGIHQQSQRNPYGMDEECQNCPSLCSVRSNVVHGFGDAEADFLFINERPSAESDTNGRPLNGSSVLGKFLAEIGLAKYEEDDESLTLRNGFITHLTRCRHPKREPTQEEIDLCEPFLNAEIRTINPEILIPIGKRAIQEITREYTTIDVSDASLDEIHASQIRGRGFELIPIYPLEALSQEDFEKLVTQFIDIQGTDYRQTKGRRSR